MDKDLTGIKLLRHKRWIQDKIEGYKERKKKVKINVTNVGASRGTVT